MEVGIPVKRLVVAMQVPTKTTRKSVSISPVAIFTVERVVRPTIRFVEHNWHVHAVDNVRRVTLLFRAHSESFCTLHCEFVFRVPWEAIVLVQALLKRALLVLQPVVYEPPAAEIVFVLHLLCH